MQLYAIAIKDNATQAFMTPTFHHHPNHALRSFVDEVNRVDPANLLANHPQDFELWQVGIWDDQAGSFVTEPQRLARAVDHKKAD